MRKISTGAGATPRLGLTRPNASKALDRAVKEGAEAYSRVRDLPRLIALWPHELADESLEGGLEILSKLRRALRAERRRGRGGHWSYDLNRHLGLLSAYRGEVAFLRTRSALTRIAPGVAVAKPSADAADGGEEAAPLPRRHPR